MRRWEGWAFGGVVVAVGEDENIIIAITIDTARLLLLLLLWSLLQMTT